MFLDFSDGKGDKGKLFKLTQITKVLAPGHLGEQYKKKKGKRGTFARTGGGGSLPIPLFK